MRLCPAGGGRRLLIREEYQLQSGPCEAGLAVSAIIPRVAKGGKDR